MCCGKPAQNDQRGSERDRLDAFRKILDDHWGESHIEVLGRDASGEYFGDGKISAGGFEIPIGFLSGDGNEEFREMKWEVFNRKIMNMLFLKIGVEPETDED